MVMSLDENRVVPRGLEKKVIKWWGKVNNSFAL
jgi:hypothetical protein